MSKNTYIIVAGVGGVIIGFLAAFSLGMNVVTQEPLPTHTMHMEVRPAGQGMRSMMADMNTNLKGKTGDEFDKAFLDEMIVHHEGAVDMAALVLKNSSRGELRTLANDIIKAQTKEINEMKTWQAAWFK
jgi:uncharacterized protein (DUF305 family)